MKESLVLAQQELAELSERVVSRAAKEHKHVRADGAGNAGDEKCPPKDNGNHSINNGNNSKPASPSATAPKQPQQQQQQQQQQHQRQLPKSSCSACWASPSVCIPKSR